MQALIIADDLTGALDSAVALAAVGLRVRVARRPGDVRAALAEGPEALAVSTASREGTAEAARAAVDLVFEALGDLRPEIVFKKVDSRLKGHPGAETAVAAARAGLSRGLAAPAIPEQGRLTEGGRLTGAGVAEPIDVAARLAEAGVELAVPDVADAGDLDRALAAALEAGPALLVGAAGLSAALARRLRPGARAERVAALPGPILLAVGSRDPITLAQVAALRASGRAVEVLAPDGAPSAQVPRSGAVLLRLTAGNGPFRPKAAGPRFAESAARALRASGAATLFGCGGETADAILGALGVGVLAVEGEILPGVPVSRMAVEGREIRLVTKSGGFGGPGALVSLVDAAAELVEDSGEEPAR
jgi:uncharacterized protein YgbK (DUF1537 family)